MLAHPPTPRAIIQETHRRGPINLVNDQAIGLPTSTQHRLHLCSSLNMRAEGLRAAVITGTVKRNRGYRDSCDLCQGSSQCPWQDGRPGPCYHTYTLRIPHKKTPNPSDLRRGVVHSQCPWDPSPISNTQVSLTQPNTSGQKRNPVTRPCLHSPCIHFYHTVPSMPCNHVSQGGLAQPWGSTQQRNLQPRYMKTCCNRHHFREFLGPITEAENPRL